MDNNDILRRLRYTFDYDDDTMMALFKSAGREASRAQISDWLKKEDDPSYQPIYDIDLAAFLNGMIIKYRGKKDDQPVVNEKSLNNNQIFRKLRIALSFKDTDIMDMFELADLRVSKHEISAIFRRPEQKQYRVCKDQFLRNFLYGLQKSKRKSK